MFYCQKIFCAKKEYIFIHQHCRKLRHNSCAFWQEKAIRIYVFLQPVHQVKWKHVWNTLNFLIPQNNLKYSLFKSVSEFPKYIWFGRTFVRFLCFIIWKTCFIIWKTLKIHNSRILWKFFFASLLKILHYRNYQCPKSQLNLATNFLIVFWPFSFISHTFIEIFYFDKIMRILNL